MMVGDGSTRQSNPVLDRWPIARPPGIGPFGTYERVLGKFTSAEIAEAGVRLLTKKSEREGNLRTAGERGELSPLSLLIALQERPTQETFDVAVALCRSRATRRKVFGLRILRELRDGPHNRPFRQQTLTLLAELLNTDQDGHVVFWILQCLTWLGDVDRALTFLDDPDPDLRGVLAFHLANSHSGAPEDPRIIAALVKLAGDADAENRADAVYDFQETITADTPAIRQMLERAEADSDPTVRDYARAALMRRTVPEPVAKKAKRRKSGD